MPEHSEPVNRGEPTTLAVVLRLLSNRLAAGEVTGWLEVVATGERQALRNADDLIDALAALGSPPDAWIG
jgi:hypothetical protein